MRPVGPSGGSELGPEIKQHDLATIVAQLELLTVLVNLFDLQRLPANGQMANLGSALRKETVEAAQENEGEKTVTGERRQTERGSATATYSHTAPADAARGRSAAPPTVPEARRQALRSYFIRKQ